MQNFDQPAFPAPCGHAVVTKHQPGVGSFNATIEVCRTGITKLELLTAICFNTCVASTDEKRAERAAKQAMAILDETEKYK